MAVKPTVVTIEKQIFTPALQQAMKKAEDTGYDFSDSIMGATNAHLNMLVELVGAEKATSLLKREVEFLESQE
ncbi:MAG: hypothetical protein U5S82_00650 [Gammaproteobacteria bacterium]|nr:hypothetical protein [Gammaproteobacteria bacterium]